MTVLSIVAVLWPKSISYSRVQYILRRPHWSALLFCEGPLECLLNSGSKKGSDELVGMDDFIRSFVSLHSVILTFFISIGLMPLIRRTLPSGLISPPVITVGLSTLKVNPRCLGALSFFQQQFLYFFPLPQWHIWLRLFPFSNVISPIIL